MGREHFSIDIALLTDPTGWCPWNTDILSPRQPQQPHGAPQTAPKQQVASHCTNINGTAGTSMGPSCSRGGGGSIGSQPTSSNRNSSAHALPSRGSKAPIAARCTTHTSSAQSTTDVRASIAPTSAAQHKQQSHAGSPCPADMQHNSRASRFSSPACTSSGDTTSRAHSSQKGMLVTPRTMLSLPTTPMHPGGGAAHHQYSSEANRNLPTRQNSALAFLAPQFCPKVTSVKRHGATTSRQASAASTTAQLSSAASTATDHNSYSPKGRSVLKLEEAAAAGRSCSNLLQTAATATVTAIAAPAVAGSLTLNHAWEQQVSAGGATATSSAVGFCSGSSDIYTRSAARPAAVASIGAAVDCSAGQPPELAVTRAVCIITSTSAAPAVDILGERPGQLAAAAATTGRPALKTLTVPPAGIAGKSKICSHQELNPGHLDRVCGTWGTGSKQSSTFTAAAVAGAAARMVQSSDTAAAVDRMLRYTAAAEARLLEMDRASQPQLPQQRQQQPHRQQQQQIVSVSEQGAQQKLQQLLLGRLYPQMNSSQLEQSATPPTAAVDKEIAM